jgi:hypothetical protein
LQLRDDLANALLPGSRPESERAFSPVSGKMEGAGGVRFLRQLPNHHENCLRNVDRRGRASELIGNHFQLVALCGKTQNGAQEIAAIDAVNP